jgi:hypothetical protein
MNSWISISVLSLVFRSHFLISSAAEKERTQKECVDNRMTMTEIERDREWKRP